MGEKDPGRYPRPDGVWVGHNRPGIFPESLYQAQWESRVNDVRIFSVYPVLEKVNDSAFILLFNMPIIDFFAAPENFSVSGNTGYEGSEFSVTVESDTSVKLVFDGIGPLPAFSTITVRAETMFSVSGESLEGLTAATYTEPDLRPVVTGVTARVNNEDGTLEASSSKPGSIYLVLFNGDYNYLDAYKSVSELEQAVSDNLGRKVDAPVANTPVTISTKGLPGGFYLYFAVDEDGRMSLPADEWPEVEETGPVDGIDDEIMIPAYSVWYSNATIFIQPDDHSVHYTVRLYDMTGRSFTVRENLIGEQQLVFPDYSGILIVRIISENGISTGTHKLLYNP